MDAIGDNLFIIIFLLISFFSWVSGKIKERAGQAPPTFEERPDADPTFRESRESAPTAGEDPMRQIMEALGIPTQEQQAPPSPPPLPQERSPEPSPPPKPFQRPDVKPVKELLSKEERDALARLQSGESRRSKRRSRELISPRAMLNSHNLQAAYILKEILDKPKCLRAAEE